MDSISQQALSVDEVKYETNALYAAALNELREKGVEIQSVVCDGRKGLLQMFPEIPAQLCQFHRVKTVSRYLTRNPKTAAGKALWRLTLPLKDSGKTAFQGARRRGLSSMRASSKNERPTRKAAVRTTRTRR